MNPTSYTRLRVGPALSRLLLFCCCWLAMPALRAQQATEEWAARYSGQASSLLAAVSIAVDSFGNSYVTGTSSDNAGGVSKLVTVKYSPAGQQLWLNEYSGGSAQAIAVDNAGGVYVTGTLSVSTSDTDYLTV